MTVYAVPITKAKKNIPFDSDLRDKEGERIFTDEVMQAIFAEGLKVILNKNMSKITVKDLDGDELAEAQAAALAKAEENLENLKNGMLRKRKTSSKEPREVITHAMNKARKDIRAAYKDAGKKITGIAASVITQAAKDYLEDHPEILEEAREEVRAMNARESKPVKVTNRLADLIAQAETAKPKVPPKRKGKAEQATVIAAKSKGGTTKHATAH